MNLLSDPTPNTTNYMIAGYIVIFGVMAIYIFSLWWRQRRLARELELLESEEIT